MELEGKKIAKAEDSEITLDDGTVLVVSEVIRPKSVIDRLMDGEGERLWLVDESGDVYLGDYRVEGLHLVERTPPSLRHLFPASGEVCIVQLRAGLAGETPVDLDELRRRVATREIKRLASYASMADLAGLLPKDKPDISKEWWVIDEHGLPELKDDVIYASYWVEPDGAESERSLRYYGCRYNVEGRNLVDFHGDVVTRIKEAS